jgi:hypothetical protein
MPQYFKDHGEELVRRGYFIVPLPPGSKGPRMDKWPQARLTEEDVRRMAANGSAQAGVGVLAVNMLVIDVDILDERIADQMSAEIDAIFGPGLWTRTGKAPKFLVPFRADTPIRKMSSAKYTDGTNEHKVEILGDGQQWVAYHVHPDTGTPYAWFDGVDESGIRDVNRADLPCLTRSDAQRVIDAFERIASGMVASGAWHLAGGRVAEREIRDTESDPFAQHAEPTDLSAEQVIALIHKVTDYDDRDQWLRIGRMVHHHFAGSEEGFEIWEAWSTNGQKYNAEDQRRVWDSFGHSDKPETLRALLKEFGQPPAEHKPRTPNAGFVQAAKFASAQRVEWHIKHVIPKRALIVIYGEPGSSKSFFALDMVACVARGVEWRGHRVRQSRVAYIAAEGVAGFGNRLAAYAKHNALDLADVPVFVRGGAFDLREEYLAIADDVKAISDVGIVVIDTLAAATPGANENTSEDMGAAIDAAQKIIEYTGASVILIHHSNNQGTIRGWSGLRGAVDNQIRIERKETLRTAHIEKQKEGAEGPPVGYRLKVIDLYTDEDGDPVTSCVVVPDEETVPNSRVAKKERASTAGDFENSRKNMHGRRYLEIIADLGGIDGTNVDIDMIVEAAQSDEMLNTSGEPDNPTKRSITRSVDRLGEKGKLRREGRWIRLC